MLARTNRLHLLLSLFLYAFFAVVLIWPMVWVVRFGFVARDGHFTLEYLKLIFHDQTLVRGLENATILACVVTVATLALSLPLAVLGVRYEFPGRRWLGGLLLVPLVLPPFVGAIGDAAGPGAVRAADDAPRRRRRWEREGIGWGSIGWGIIARHGWSSSKCWGSIQ